MAIEQAKKAKGEASAQNENGAAAATATTAVEADDGKFTYVPIHVHSKDASAMEKGAAEAVAKDDGSFMETMRRVMGKS